MAEHLLGIDAGSTGVRALVFGPDGSTLASAYREVAVNFPRPGWVEQDGGQLRRSTLEVVGEALARAGLKAGDLAGLGIANQRSSVMAWDGKTMEPLSPMISWQDVRTEERCRELMAAGLYITPMLAASKAEWIMKNSPQVASAAAAGSLRLGTANSWLAAVLTGGEHVSDHANASATGLYAYFEQTWDGSALEALGLEAAWLPRLVDSSAVVGATAAGVLDAAVPVAAMCGDQQSSLFGLGCFGLGQTKCSYGTSAMIDTNTGDSVAAGGPGTYPLVAWSGEQGVRYCVEGNVVTAGAAVQWLRDGLGLVAEVSQTAEVAASVSDSGGVWVVPAFQGLGTPVMEGRARAVVGGLSRASRGAHVVRALLDGIAQRVADIAESLWQSIERPPVMRVDGGASRNDFLMQRQADLLGLPIERGYESDGAALGAAMLAGLGVGLWKEVGEGLWHCERVFDPALPEQRRVEERESWKKRLAAVAGLAEGED